MCDAALVGPRRPLRGGALPRGAGYTFGQVSPTLHSPLSSLPLSFSAQAEAILSLSLSSWARSLEQVHICCVGESRDLARGCVLEMIGSFFVPSFPLGVCWEDTLEVQPATRGRAGGALLASACHWRVTIGAMSAPCGACRVPC